MVYCLTVKQPCEIGDIDKAFKKTYLSLYWEWIDEDAEIIAKLRYIEDNNWKKIVRNERKVMLNLISNLAELPPECNINTCVYNPNVKRQTHYMDDYELEELIGYCWPMKKPLWFLDMVEYVCKTSSSEDLEDNLNEIIEEDFLDVFDESEDDWEHINYHGANKEVVDEFIERAREM